jgi:hypothetical protein
MDAQLLSAAPSHLLCIIQRKSTARKERRAAPFVAVGSAGADIQPPLQRAQRITLFLMPYMSLELTWCAVNCQGRTCLW